MSRPALHLGRGDPVVSWILAGIILMSVAHPDPLRRVLRLASDSSHRSNRP